MKIKKKIKIKLSVFHSKNLYLLDDLLNQIKLIHKNYEVKFNIFHYLEKINNY